MANFYIAIKHVLEHEGGYVDHKNDPGGATKYGISLRFLKKQGSLVGDFDGDGDVDPDDIAAMTEPQAKQIYEKFFWNANRLREVKSQMLANKIFDMAVNMGSRQAWKLTQRAISRHGHPLVDDGVVGPNTLNALNAVEKIDYDVIMTLRGLHRDFYEGIIRNNSDFRVFRLGWFRRAAF